MAFKITVDDTCVGCGACTAVCDNFEMDGAKAKPKEEQVEEIGCNQEAADACPQGSIKVEEV